ncbi:MAG: PAS domain S-box protein [Desulfobacteraceae bacterium]|jgi:PAS domain S-box-containing protein
MDQSILDRTPLSEEELQTAFWAVEHSYRLLAEYITDLLFTLDEGGMILSINPAVARYGHSVDELIGQSMRFLIHPEDRDALTDVLSEAAAHKADCTGLLQLRLVAKTGKMHEVDCRYAIGFGPGGQFLFMQGICRPSDTKTPDRDPFMDRGARSDILIENRYLELVRANEEMQNELLERRATERALRNREADLELDKANLEETNTALRVLLKRREMDKHEFEEQVMYNVREMILPYLDTLKTLTSDERQHAYLAILDSNLGDITKAFSRRLSLDFYNLSPSEFKVAIFIRQGKKTREIAALLGLSKRTIDAVRQSIRRKLRIQNRRINLRTFLMSIN